jgi:thiamine-phosphate pyrophosphorylase
LLLCYISDRSQFPGDEDSRRSRLLETIAFAVRCGVDYVQLREKDLSSHELEILAREAVAVAGHLKAENKELKTGLLINSRTDIAVVTGAAGVHLRADDISPAEVRKIWAQCGAGTLARATVAISCHTPAEVAQGAADGADFAVFGPIFEKKGEKKGAPSLHPVGLDALREACREKIPVLALGGITVKNAEACVEAGAAGIAGIRLFQENEVSRVVRALRGLKSQ